MQVKVRLAYDMNLGSCGDGEALYDAQVQDEDVACEADFDVLDVDAGSACLDLDAFVEEEFEPLLTQRIDANSQDDPDSRGKLRIPTTEIKGLPPESGLNNLRTSSLCFRNSSNREALPSIVFSGVMHVCLLMLLTILPTYGKGGATSIEQGSVMVKLVEQNSDEVPTDESPGSRDAPASLPMTAKRSPEAAKEAPQPLHAARQTFLDQSESSAQEAAGHASDERAGRHDSPTFVSNAAHLPQWEQQENDSRFDETMKDRTRVDSVHAYDSASSVPSVASPQRVPSAAAGTTGDEYRNKILSAISAAAFYPKRALAERIYGETVVTFTINKGGSIIHLSVKKPSGYNVLDDAAMTIVRKASKHFPSIPDELTTDSISYDVPIIFKKRS